MEKPKPNSAEENLQSRLKVEETFGGKQSQRQINAIVSQNILHSDLGYHSDDLGPDYSLSDSVRDRLTAHARQDASLAALNAGSSLEELKAVRKSLRSIKRCGLFWASP